MASKTNLGKRNIPQETLDNQQLETPDYIFETSWEVCNKVGGIYTVLSTRAKSMRELYGDRVCFVGPDLGQGGDGVTDFEEDATLLPEWRKAWEAEGLSCRVGRWNVPGKPFAVLVNFSACYERKNAIYAKAWELFGVDSLHAYGDYDEASMFSYAAGEAVACLCRNVLPGGARVIYQAHEWMSGLGMLFLKHSCPRVATVFTTHATSIGRSIAGNNKLLYEYFEGYNGDQMAGELNMQSKHSIEKQSAHRADCFTTVSTFTARECTQLLDKTPDVILPNGFEPDFVPRGSAFTSKRRRARKLLLDVLYAMTGCRWGDDTLIISTSGRNDFRCKGFDVFIDALAHLRQQPPARNVLALIEVPCWVGEAREEIATRLAFDQTVDSPVDLPFLTHWLHNMDSDRILNMLRQHGLVNAPEDKVKVLFVPCYLDGADGIFNLPYYDLLIANDLCVYPSYYEPWGYTPLEAAAFKIPCVTTDLSGFGQWVDSVTGHASGIADGVEVLHRTDLNYFDVVQAVCRTVHTVASLPPARSRTIREKAQTLAGHARWTCFIDYYRRAYDFAIRRAGEPTNIEKQ